MPPIPSMPAVDPREQLITWGQELLDALYTEHLFRQKFERIMDLARRNPDPSDPNVQLEVNAFLEEQGMTLVDLLEASFTGMEMAEEIMAKRERYLILRQTIEALDAPRPTIPPDPQPQSEYSQPSFAAEDPDDRRLTCVRCGSLTHMTQECNK